METFKNVDELIKNLNESTKRLDKNTEILKNHRLKTQKKRKDREE